MRPELPAAVSATRQRSIVLQGRAVDPKVKPDAPNELTLARPSSKRMWKLGDIGSSAFVVETSNTFQQRCGEFFVCILILELPY